MASISLNRFSKHVSVHEQIVVRTCQKAAPSCTTSIKILNWKLKNTWKNVWQQKNVGTTVSSREVGIKRREERNIMSSQKNTEIDKDQTDDKKTRNGGGRQKLKHVDGDFPWFKRRKSEDNEATTIEHEKSRGKRGSRQKLRRWRSAEHAKHRRRRQRQQQHKKKLKSAAAEIDSRIKAACGSKDLRGSRTIKENKESAKTEEKDITFIVLRKLWDQWTQVTELKKSFKFHQVFLLIRFSWKSFKFHLCCAIVSLLNVLPITLIRCCISCSSFHHASELVEHT